MNDREQFNKMAFQFAAVGVPVTKQDCCDSCKYSEGCYLGVFTHDATEECRFYDEQTSVNNQTLQD